MRYLGESLALRICVILCMISGWLDGCTLGADDMARARGWASLGVAPPLCFGSPDPTSDPVGIPTRVAPVRRLRARESDGYISASMPQLDDWVYTTQYAPDIISLRDI